MIVANLFALSEKSLSSPYALTPNPELGLEFNTHVDYRAVRTDKHIHHIPSWVALGKGSSRKITRAAKAPGPPSQIPENHETSTKNQSDPFMPSRQWKPWIASPDDPDKTRGIMSTTRSQK